MRRISVIDHFRASARLSLYRGDHAKFLLFLLVGLVRHPDSLARGFLLRFPARQTVNRLRPSAEQATAARG